MKPRSQSHLQPLSLFNGFNIRFLLFYVFILLVSLEVIKSGFVVKKLPGWLGDLPFTLETGYVGVGESNDVQLFYYFIESEGNPENDPLILWLTGGPGCSALSSILYEIATWLLQQKDHGYLAQITAHKTLKCKRCS
uniref:Uncharacterized protein n=1 Tax=Lactuca sativa TaxID=4236 RepID=A0A9R1X8M5_LACSA|nr:hypothetical protein LSAT_V11C500268130 [Lactuca sativa]